MQEQRLTARLTAYWEMLRKDAPMPHFARFNQGVVGDLWPNCMVLAAQPTAAGKAAFRVQSVGDNLIAIFGNDLAGREASRLSLRTLGGGKIAGCIEEAAVTHLCAETDGNFVSGRNKIVKYRACLLPFSPADQETVSHIVAGISWREF